MPLGVRTRGAGRRDVRASGFGRGTRTTPVVSVPNVQDGAVDQIFNLLTNDTALDSPPITGIMLRARTQIYNILTASL